jgi:hypothetical protein
MELSSTTSSGAPPQLPQLPRIAPLPVASSDVMTRPEAGQHLRLRPTSPACAGCGAATEVRCPDCGAPCCLRCFRTGCAFCKEIGARAAQVHLARRNKGSFQGKVKARGRRAR